MDVVLQWYVHLNIACTQHVELKGKKNVSLDGGCVSKNLKIFKIVLPGMGLVGL